VQAEETFFRPDTARRTALPASSSTATLKDVGETPRVQGAADAQAAADLMGRQDA
jgi:hypothetical protein